MAGRLWRSGTGFPIRVFRDQATGVLDLGHAVNEPMTCFIMRRLLMIRSSPQKGPPHVYIGALHVDVA